MVKSVVTEKKPVVKQLPSDSSDKDSKTYALLGSILLIIGFIIVKIQRPSDKYAMYYAKQGLVLGAVWIILMFATMFLSFALVFIPFIGWMFSILLWMLSSLIYLGLLVLWIIGIINSASGEQKSMPVIGGIADKINF